MSLSRQQLTLIGIFALFMGPVILVMMMRSYPFCFISLKAGRVTWNAPSK